MPSLSRAADFVPGAVWALVAVIAAGIACSLAMGVWSRIGTAAGSLLP